MKRLVFLIVAGALVAAGCGPSLGKNLNIQLMKSDPPAGCRMIGDIQADGDDMNEAKAYLREEAAEKRANYVRLDAVDLTGANAIIAGTAYRCLKPNSEPEPESAEMPAKIPTEKSADKPSAKALEKLN